MRGGIDGTQTKRLKHAAKAQTYGGGLLLVLGGVGGDGKLTTYRTHVGTRASWGGGGIQTG